MTTQRALVIALTLLAGPAAAQPAATLLRIGPDEAVALALEHDLTLRAERLGPAIAATETAGAVSAWSPSVFSHVSANNNRTAAATAFDASSSIATQEQISSDLGVAQRLPWGTSYS